MKLDERWHAEAFVRKGYRHLRLVSLVFMTGLASQAAHATGSDFGVTGLIDLPSARVAEDGLLTSTYARQKLVDIYSLTYQVTPWLETAFRYSIFNPRDIEGSEDRGRDRSFEAKLRLLQERRWRPQVAIGARDILGTGDWGGEYLVASKRWGRLDASIGLGWGRFSERAVSENPFRAVSERFETRERDTGGGTFNPQSYFSGEDVGLFGGVRYDLPRWNTSLVAEYNSDAYEREEALGSIDDPSPISVGIEWTPRPNLTFAVSWQQGDQIGLRITAGASTKAIPPRKPPNDFSVDTRATDTPDIESPGPTWYEHMVAAATPSGVLIRSADPMGDERLNIVYSNQQYQLEADAIQRVLTLAEVYVPKRFRSVTLTGFAAGGTTHSVHYKRTGSSKWAKFTPGREDPDRPAPTVVAPVKPRTPAFKTNFVYPSVQLSGNLGLTTYIFDPRHPFLFQLFARANADVELGDGWVLSGSWVQNLYNEFDEIDRAPTSELPHVRTDLVKYLKQGETGLDRLALTKRGKLTDRVHYKAFAGYLEWMYAGAGAEVLYQPYDSNFAVGANLIGVRKRDFDRSFELRDYQTIIGHLSGYWASPILNMDFAIHAGRYLARDWGATFEIQRRFANGWSIGAFFTFTDVPFSKFGEGSFDKGLILRVPFNSLFGSNTRAAFRTNIRPLQRDGGQRLPDWGSTLWETLRHTRHDRLTPYRERMLP